MWSQFTIRLSVLGTTPIGVFAKAMMKARLPDSFVGKERKTNKMWPWLL